MPLDRTETYPGRFDETHTDDQGRLHNAYGPAVVKYQSPTTRIDSYYIHGELEMTRYITTTCIETTIKAPLACQELEGDLKLEYTKRYRCHWPMCTDTRKVLVKGRETIRMIANDDTKDKSTIDWLNFEYQHDSSLEPSIETFSRFTPDPVALNLVFNTDGTMENPMPFINYDYDLTIIDEGVRVEYFDKAGSKHRELPYPAVFLVELGTTAENYKQITSKDIIKNHEVLKTACFIANGKDYTEEIRELGPVLNWDLTSEAFEFTIGVLGGSNNE